MKWQNLELQGNEKYLYQGIVLLNTSAAQFDLNMLPTVFFLGGVGFDHFSQLAASHALILFTCLLLIQGRII